MIQRLQRIAIGNRFLVLSVLSLGLGIGLSTILITWQAKQSHRQHLVEDMKSVAELVAADATEAVYYEHNGAARDALNPLRSHKRILACQLTSLDGQAIASYRQKDTPVRHIADAPKGISIRGGELHLVELLSLNGQAVGSLYIRADASSTQAHGWHFKALLSGILAIAVGLSLCQARLFHRWVHQPVEGIIETMRRIVTERDFALRSEHPAEPDWYALNSSLNALLEDFQAHDRKLQRARVDLELRIEERTSKLLEARSQRKVAEKKLQQSGEEYRQLVETSSGLIWSVDTEGKWSFLNGMASQLIFGCQPDQLIGQPFVSRSAPEHAKGDARMIQSLIAGRPIFSYETVHRHSDGSFVHLSFNAVTLYNERNEIIGATGSAIDVTARNLSIEREKELQGQLARAERMEALGLLAGGVAHDLNNILGPIVAYPDLIQEELPPDSPALEDLDEIKKSATRAAAVIQDLLTLSRRGGYQTESLYLNETVEDYLGSASFKEKSALYPDIALEKDFCSEPLPIEGSVPHLSQVIMNLIINALEAMETSGKLTVSLQNEFLQRPVGTYDTVEPGHYMVLRVTDCGPGIPPDSLEKIFEPFYSDKKMGRSGTGLGLAVVYGVVKDLKGYIDVRTKPGVGTEFVLYFPVTSRLPERNLTREQDYSGTERILVVDDIPEQRNLAKRVLSKMGYEVAAAVNGRAAIAHLLAYEVDLVIIDMVMEDDFDGLDTFLEIQQMKLMMPCIIASGFSENNRVAEALKRGVQQYIKKPYTTQEIGKVVRETLDQHQLTAGSLAAESL